MQTGEALRVAIDIVQAPSRVHHARTSPLPGGVVEVLEIAAGDEALIARIAHETGRAPSLVVEAATFFIEQVLLYPEADSYRMLGATPLAPSAELRRNMALLMRWLHPDLMKCAERSVFANRISNAWDSLKTADRRVSYDDQRAAMLQGAGQGQTRGRGERGKFGRSRSRAGVKRAAAADTSARSGRARPNILRRLFQYLFTLPPR